MTVVSLIVRLALGVPIAYGCAVLFAPGWMLERSRALEARLAGLTRKTVQVDDHEVAYFEGGQGQPLLLVHGFGASKDMWPRYAKELMEHYRVVVPDLPGFGDSSYIKGARYGCREQAARLNGLLDALDLGPVHIGGNSMGGSIAGTFAALYPEMTRSLLLMNNGAMAMPSPSDYQKDLDAGRNPLIVRSLSDVPVLFAYAFGKPPVLPPLAGRIVAHDAVPRANDYAVIFDQIAADEDLLTGLLNQITAPTLVMWGRLDRVLDVSIVDTIDAHMTHHEKVIYDDLGHIPAMEDPKRSARDHLSFLQSSNRAG